MIALAFLAITVAMSSPPTVVSDPVNGSLGAMAIPGALVDYTTTVTNSSGLPLSGNTVVVTDAIPAGTKLYVGDLGSAGSGPVAFAQGLFSSNLTYTYSSLASTSDNLDFSNNGGSTYTYTPVADSSGSDATVTNIRIRPQGTAAVAGIFTIKFRVGVK